MTYALRNCYHSYYSRNTVTVFASFMEGLGKVADTAARGRGELIPNSTFLAMPWKIYRHQKLMISPYFTSTLPLIPPTYYLMDFKS